MQLVEHRPDDGDAQSDPRRAAPRQSALARERHEPQRGEQRVFRDVRDLACEEVERRELGVGGGGQQPAKEGTEDGAGVLRAELGGGEPRDGRHPQQRRQPKREALHVAMIQSPRCSARSWTIC